MESFAAMAVVACVTVDWLLFLCLWQTSGQGRLAPIVVKLFSLVNLYYLDIVKTTSGQGRAALAQSRITQDSIWSPKVERKIAEESQ